MTHEVLVVSGPFACYLRFDGSLARGSCTVAETAPVWRKFVGQPTKNLLNWLLFKFGSLTIHSLDGSGARLDVPAREAT